MPTRVQWAKFNNANSSVKRKCLRIAGYNRRDNAMRRNRPPVRRFRGSARVR